MENLKFMVRQNLLQNFPVTIEDINNSEKIFGKDVSTLKGRSTRKRPIPFVDDCIDIPKEIIDNNQKNSFHGYYVYKSTSYVDSC